MAHAEDLAYLVQKIGKAEFESLIADWAEDLRQLEAEKGKARVVIGEHDVKAGNVVDTWRQPRPVRYRSKSA